MPVIYRGMQEEEFWDALDNLMKDGQIRGACPHCGINLVSIFEKECSICKKEIDRESIRFWEIESSKAN